MLGGHRWRRFRGGKKAYINRHIRFDSLHDKFKGKLSFENWDTKKRDKPGAFTLTILGNPYQIKK